MRWTGLQLRYDRPSSLSPIIDQIPQPLTDRKGEHARGGDGDALTRGRIAALTLPALFDLKGAKAIQADLGPSPLPHRTGLRRLPAVCWRTMTAPQAATLYQVLTALAGSADPALTAELSDTRPVYCDL